MDHCSETNKNNNNKPDINLVRSRENSSPGCSSVECLPSILEALSFGPQHHINQELGHQTPLIPASGMQRKGPQKGKVILGSVGTLRLTGIHETPPQK